MTTHSCDHADPTFHSNAPHPSRERISRPPRVPLVPPRARVRARRRLTDAMSSPKSAKKEKKDKKDKKDKRRDDDDAKSAESDAKKQRKSAPDADGGGDAASPTRVRVVGLTRSATAQTLSAFLGLDAANVVVGMWGTHGKGPKPPGGQAFATAASRRDADALVAKYHGATLDGTELKVIVDTGDVAIEAHGGVTPGKEAKETGERPPLFGGGGSVPSRETSSISITHEVRADDWSCAACGCSNFARRTSCFRCAAPRSATTSGAPATAVNTAAARASAQGSEQEGYEVFLKYLPHSANEDEVYNFFAACGAIVGPARLLRDPQSGQAKGAGFITFADETGRNEALKLDGARFGGRNVSVTVAKRSSFGVRATEQAFGTHTPAMLAETIAALVAPDRSGVYVDGTFGRGGHSRGILAALSSEGRLHAFDMDPEAIKVGKELEKEDPRFKIHHAPFGCMAQVLKPLGIKPAGVFLDLGISSPQFDDASRGFRPEQDGPLDLRFDVERGVPASEYLRLVGREELRRVIHEYGETTDAIASRRIADAIVLAREDGSLPNTTKEFAALVAKAKGKEYQAMHPAKLTFQALRIVLNQEFDEMRRGMHAAFDIMPEHGRLGILTWKHSECAIVVDFFRDYEVIRDDFPLYAWALANHGDKCSKKLERKWGLHMDDAQRPSEAEMRANSRSRSAVLHVLRKREAVRISDLERVAYKLKGWGKIPDPAPPPPVTFKYDVPK